jgi:hypothetical protein
MQSSERDHADRTNRRVTPRPPVCPDCQKQMRFVASVPDGTDAALWRVMFTCDCGRAADQVIAQT